jgi:hypothetical protein
VCSQEDDPTYDRMVAERVRRAAITRDGTQLDTRPGFRQPGEMVNGIYTVVAPGSAKWVAQQPGYLPAPGESVQPPGRPARLALFPSFIMVAGWHALRAGDQSTISDDPEGWFTFGWLKMSLWHRDPNADVYDAEMELIPLLNKAVPRWFNACPDCKTEIYSALDLLQHMNTAHNWSLHTIESWLRLANEARITLPQEGDAVDTAE